MDIEEEILNIKEDIKLLNEKLDNLYSKFNLSKEKNQVLGFYLTLKSIKIKDKIYEKWYAYKKINGKQHWIYIGNNIAKAEEKIKNWMDKNWQFSKK